MTGTGATADAHDVQIDEAGARGVAADLFDSLRPALARRGAADVRGLRHLVLLARDVVAFSSRAGAVWMLPLLILLVVVGVLVFSANAAVPYVVYTFL